MFEPINQISLESLAMFIQIFAAITLSVSILLTLVCVVGIALQIKYETSSKPAFGQKSGRFENYCGIKNFPHSKTKFKKIKEINSMKKLLTIALLMFAAASFAVAQKSADGKTEQELVKIIREIQESASRGEKTTIERYMTDDYIYTNSNGKVISRTQLLEQIQPPPKGSKSDFEIKDVQTRVYGDTAILSVRMDGSVEINNQKNTSSDRDTAVFVRRNGQWKLLSEHYSEIPAMRVAAKIDTKVYDQYVGQYELAPDFILTITREGDKLIGQSSRSKTKTELLPENETTFFIQGQRSKTIFEKDETGKVVGIISRGPDGQEIKAKKIK